MRDPKTWMNIPGFVAIVKKYETDVPDCAGARAAGALDIFRQRYFNPLLLLLNLRPRPPAVRT